mmetsp:Transcript_5351/g.13520  ORF Transcript_5351/g.13520 Transcript_5351/m.13520 type:complete len:228 (-) Transcript_5351:2523-3206(-)
MVYKKSARRQAVGLCMMQMLLNRATGTTEVVVVVPVCSIKYRKEIRIDRSGDYKSIFHLDFIWSSSVVSKWVQSNVAMVNGFCSLRTLASHFFVNLLSPNVLAPHHWTMSTAQSYCPFSTRMSASQVMCLWQMVLKPAMAASRQFPTLSSISTAVPAASGCIILTSRSMRSIRCALELSNGGTSLPNTLSKHSSKPTADRASDTGPVWFKVRTHTSVDFLVSFIFRR